MPSTPGRRPVASTTVAALLAGGFALTGLLVAAPAQAALDTRLFGVASTVVYRIDETSGVATALTGGTAFATNAAARQPASTLIYYTANAASAGVYAVGTYDVTSGATATLAGTVNAGLARLAFTPSGDLYGMNGTALYHIDPNNGSTLAQTTVTSVGGPGITGGGDIAFQADGTAYIVAGTSLYRMPAPYTTATYVGPTGGSAHPNLAFGSSGRLWTASPNTGTSANSDIGYLNPTTGAETNVSTVVGATFTDMASSPDRPPVITGGPAASNTGYVTAQTTDVSSYASDPDGDPITYVSASAGGAGSATVDSSGNVTFTPAAGFSGPATITYQIADGVGGFATGTYSVTVGDAAPAYSGAASNTAQSVARGTGTLSPLIASDPNTSDTLTYSIVTGSLPVGVTLNTATGAFSGSPTTVGSSSATIRVDDGQGMHADTVLAVTVTNQAPSYTGAGTNTAQTVAVGGSVTALAATDPNNDTLTYNRLTGALPPGITLNSNGTFSGTAGGRGTYTATIQVADGLGGTSSTTLAITVPNVAPVFTGAASNGSQTVVHGHPLTPLAATDANGDTLTYDVSGGVLPAGTTLNADGTWAGAPTALGTFNLTVRATDPTGAAVSRALTITVTNAAPVFTGAPSNTSQTVAHNTALTSIAATDADGDTVTYTVASGTLPTGVTLNANGSWAGTPSQVGTFPGIVIDAADAYGSTPHTLSITVTNAAPAFTSSTNNTAQTVARGATPAPVAATDANGDGITYSRTGGQLPPGVTINPDGTFSGSPTARGSFTATITATDAPYGATGTTVLTITVPDAPPAFTGAQGNTAQGLVRGEKPAPVHATDVDGDTVTYAVTGGTLPAGITLNPDGSFGGAATTDGSTTVTITADDGHGGTAPTTLTITVSAAGSPVLVPDSASTTYGTSVTTDVLGNDSDPHLYPLTVVAVGQPAHGATAIDAAGRVVYTPAAGFSGADSYTYTADNGQGGSGTATVSVNVTPKASADTASTDPTSGTVSIAVLGNDDGALLPGSLRIVTAPAHGTTTVSPSGVVTYTRTPGYVGGDSFTYEASDANGNTVTGTVSLTVAATPPAPTALATTGIGTASQSTRIVVPTGGSVTLLDPNGVATSVVAVPGEGTYALDPATGVVSFVPASGFTGKARGVTYRVSTVDGQSATAVYTATVTPGPVAPLPPTATQTSPAPAPAPGAPTPRVVAPALAVANGPRGTVPVSCKLSAGQIGSCTVTLYATVSGRQVAIGTGTTTVPAGRNVGSVTVDVTLNPVGKALAAVPGGTKVRAVAAVHQRGRTAPLPAQTTTRIVARTVIAPRPVFFDSTKYVIQKDDLRYLQTLRTQLAGVRSIDCDGYTDNEGTYSSGIVLGAHRADVVCTLLVKGTKITVHKVSHSESSPHATNRTEKGRALNRRTVIRLHY